MLPVRAVVGEVLEQNTEAFRAPQIKTPTEMVSFQISGAYIKF